MALNVTPTNNCNQIAVTITYTNSQASYPLTGDLDILNVDGSSVVSGSVPSFQITASGGSAKRIIATSDLSITNGIVKVVFKIGAQIVEESYALLHCDIDCCLAKLTNELIDCACDCERCSKALAQAQKVFLLVKSADFALVQASQAALGNQSGYVLDADNKYKKALEICNETCGCNC